MIVGKKSKLAEMMAIMCKPARMIKLELSLQVSTPAVEAGSTQKLAGMSKARHSVVHECLFMVGVATD